MIPRRCSQLILVVALAPVAALVTACGHSAAPTPAPTSTATSQAVPRATTAPSPTPSPTATPAPPPTTTPSPSATPSPSPTPNPLASVPGIVDPSNRGWPRQVHTLNGTTTIQQQPQRIVAVDVGHAEIAYGLVPASRIVAVGAPAQSADYSNVANVAASADTVGRDPEQIIAEKPDVVLESPYAPASEIKTLENAGVTVLQTTIHNDPSGRVDDALLLGYALGATTRAEQLDQDVTSRLQAIQQLIQNEATSSRPRVLDLAKYADKLYTAGVGSTEGSIIEAAGGINVAAQAGLKASPQISTEGIVSMKPDVIIIPEPAKDGDPFKQELMSNPALASVPAIQNHRVYVVSAAHFTTLSFWNVLGVQDLAKILWPKQFAGVTFPAFTMPNG